MSIDRPITLNKFCLSIKEKGKKTIVLEFAHYAIRTEAMTALSKAINPIQIEMWTEDRK